MDKEGESSIHLRMCIIERAQFSTVSLGCSNLTAAEKTAEKVTRAGKCHAQPHGAKGGLFNPAYVLQIFQILDSNLVKNVGHENVTLCCKLSRELLALA